jgi:hypothetical protein
MSFKNKGARLHYLTYDHWAMVEKKISSDVCCIKCNLVLSLCLSQLSK